MKMDAGCLRIIRTLEKAGYEAYAAGGCVRDALLNRVPDDWDITTSARPEAVKTLFPRTFDTGIAHGTVTVLDAGVGYEVTTYRVDGVYSDHRRPDSVAFSSSLFEDVARRDFTINAMVMHPDKGIIDYFGGREDLQKRVIRCVGEPEKRFDEDALRMLRAIRFSAKLDFTIEENTWNAIVALAPTIRNVSRERIMEEITKVLISAHPERLRLAGDSGLIRSFGLDITGEEFDYDSVQRVPASRILRFAALLQRISPPKAGRLLSGLRSDNELRNGVVHLLAHVRDAAPGDPKAMRRWLHQVGKESIRSLLTLRSACLVDSPEEEERLRSLAEACGEAPVQVSELAVDGRILIQNGATQGRMIGEALSYLMEQVLENPDVNTREQLLTLFREEYREGGKRENDG